MKTICCLIAATILSACHATAGGKGYSMNARMEIAGPVFSIDAVEPSHAPTQDTFEVSYGTVSATNNLTNFLAMSSVTAPYYLWLKNASTSNDSSIFVDLTIQLRPDDFAMVPVTGTNITYYTTNDAGAVLRFLLGDE